MTGPGAGRLRVLHLAFEDHRQPGSGGGGIRTWEINRRLASDFDLTVVTTRYPGARRRVEGGVTYRPLGAGGHPLLGQATYHLAIPFYLLWHRRVDLVVEDFAAPMSSALVPLWTRRPTVAVVQWLAARETSRRYNLPFFVFEELGLRIHRRFIAVSESIAGRISAANPDADVRTIHAGVDFPDDLAVPGPAVSADILSLGRLELQPKGLDLLIEAVEQLSDIPDLRVVVAGDGPHRAEFEKLVADRGLAGRIRLVGRVAGPAKWRLLAGSKVVAMTSRYESFGLVAAEAVAAGTAVVSWALPSLVEILDPLDGRLVEPFDVAAFAAALRRALADWDHPDALSRRAEASAAARARFDWDRAAADQAEVYRAAARTGRRLLPRRDRTPRCGDV